MYIKHFCGFLSGRMKGEVIAEDGMGVRYQDLRGSKLFAQYKEQAEALRDLNLDPLTEQEKMAFFISILLMSRRS